ncbi:MAG: hypothetical protein JWP03_1264, partial [Phycisphaerales bacterium]|nr:hypothetical protein [Phycisphaerales bacterium]
SRKAAMKELGESDPEPVGAPAGEGQGGQDRGGPGEFRGSQGGPGGDRGNRGGGGGDRGRGGPGGGGGRGPRRD